MTTFIDHLGIAPHNPHDTGRPGDDAGLAVQTTDLHVNVNGGVHGGLIATLLDAVMGQAARDTLPEGRSAVTVSMTITYLSGGEIGDTLRASAEVRKQGKTLVMAEGDVVAGEDDEPIAHGVATYSVIDGN